MPVNNLTKKEAAIFEYLNSASGEVFARSEIVKQIFGQESTASNVLDVHVMNLRRKLIGTPYEVIAVRGQGYKMTSKIA